MFNAFTSLGILPDTGSIVITWTGANGTPRTSMFDYMSYFEPFATVTNVNFNTLYVFGGTWSDVIPDPLARVSAAFM